MDVKSYPIEDVPVDMTEIETRSDVVTYTSEPLDQTIVISGWPQLELWASSDRDDTDWHVKLTDVDETAARSKSAGVSTRFIPRFAGAPHAADTRSAGALSSSSSGRSTTRSCPGIASGSPPRATSPGSRAA